MSLREELERVMSSISQAKSYPIPTQVDRARDLSLFFIRNNGQALLDALEDGDRLDWLFKQWTGEALRKIGVVYSEPSEYRQAIDAAIKGEEW